MAIEIEPIDYSLFDEVEEKDIIEALKACLKISPHINPTKSLVNTVFIITKQLLINKKKYIILEAPTGSGKTIIGFMLHFVFQYIYYKKLHNIDDIINDGRVEPVPPLSYNLTSNKMLQEQIDSDLDRFDFREYISILKGVANYPCIPATEDLKKENERRKFDFQFSNDKQIEFVSYADRLCKGMDLKERSDKFPDCVGICPYREAREIASQTSSTVLNYAYFLNIMRGMKLFFQERYLTILDEAHLVPDIVCQIFNFEFNQYTLNQINNFVTEYAMNYGNSISIDLIKNKLSELFPYFNLELNYQNYNKFIQLFYDNLILINESLSHIEIKDDLNYINKRKKIRESIDTILDTKEQMNNLLSRPQDIHLESEFISVNKQLNIKVFKDIVKDLKESDMVKNNLLSKLNKGIFMSATFGNIDDYAEMMGIDKNDYIALKLPSTFDFSKSPIYLCESGYLNYNNFDSNIDKVVMDTIKICSKHLIEKGIIHTGTFKITKLLQEKVEMGLVPDKSRFLFYKTADEKQACVELMKKSLKPYIICGPSLYEGLDLKDEQGRFNIFMKVPYAQMNDYVKKKMSLYPNWYKNDMLLKVKQGIGRTNRHVNDYSTVYLLDSSFNKIIYEFDEDITNRLKYLKIY